MYKYLILGLLASAFLTVALFFWLYERLKINWAHRNRLGLSMFLPLVLALALLYVMQSQLHPRLLDVLELLHGNSENVSFQGHEATLDGAILRVRHHRFVLSPGQRQIDPGKSYRLQATPHARVVLLLEAVEEITVEETQTQP